MNWTNVAVTALLCAGMVAGLAAFGLLIADYKEGEEDRNDVLIGVLLGIWTVFWSLAVGLFE